MSRPSRLAALLLLVAACQSVADPETDEPERVSAAPEIAPAPSPRGVAPRVGPAMRRMPAGPAGAVCGDPRVIGVRLPPISSARSGCGIAEPVSLVRVAGVEMNGEARVNCDNAVALADWLERSAKPAVLDAYSVRLVGVKPAAAYACRPRNRQKGAKLSEHAKGNAIDISEFTLAGGQVVDVKSGWRGKDASRDFLRAAWAGACGPFGTVLGPESDRFHRDHFHLDVARHRNGAYCR
ncbi:MAG: extensin family protein [Pikeienuella sp.]